MGRKILVTGFQPFGGESMNPAWEAVRRLPDTIGDATVTKVEVPVVFGRGPEAVERAVEEVEPDLVLCVGQAGGRAKVTPEFVGINYADARIPDNDGCQPIAERIVDGGPDAYFATLPVKAMVQAMREAGVPAEVSYTAGTYVCNDVMYSLLHTLATRHPEVRGGFLHVPYATEQATHLPASTPSMSVDDMARGIAVALEAALTHEKDVDVATGSTH
ncbi:pyroglutamyl-peptidase I [Olsenella sp. YH-ols2223]|uniref:Pyrrolidone-carboxylate peptidase n=1 Tax=Olsenella absiana TaxID=3115222 RepID=A0ABU7R937_9ACTN